MVPVDLLKHVSTIRYTGKNMCFGHLSKVDFSLFLTTHPILCCTFPLLYILQIQDHLTVFTSYDQFLCRHFSIFSSLVGPQYFLHCDWLAEKKAADLSPCAFSGKLNIFHFHCQKKLPGVTPSREHLFPLPSVSNRQQQQTGKILKIGVCASSDQENTLLMG